MPLIFTISMADSEGARHCNRGFFLSQKKPNELKTEQWRLLHQLIFPSACHESRTDTAVWRSCFPTVDKKSQMSLSTHQLKHQVEHEEESHLCPDIINPQPKDQADQKQGFCKNKPQSKLSSNSSHLRFTCEILVATACFC